MEHINEALTPGGGQREWPASTTGISQYSISPSLLRQQGLYTHRSHPSLRNPRPYTRKSMGVLSSTVMSLLPARLVSIIGPCLSSPTNTSIIRSNAAEHAASNREKLAPYSVLFTEWNLTFYTEYRICRAPWRGLTFHPLTGSRDIVCLDWVGSITVPTQTYYMHGVTSSLAQPYRPSCKIGTVLQGGTLVVTRNHTSKSRSFGKARGPVERRVLLCALTKRGWYVLGVLDAAAAAAAATEY